MSEAWEDAPVDQLRDGRPWFIEDDEPEGDPLADAPPTAADHVWVLACEGPHPFDEEGPGLSIVSVTTTVAEAIRTFGVEQDADPFTWFRENAAGTYWQAVRWDSGKMPGWRVYSLVLEPVGP